MPRKTVTPVLERTYGTRAHIKHVVKGYKLNEERTLTKTRGKVTEFPTYRSATRAILRTIAATGQPASDFVIAQVGE